MKKLLFFASVLLFFGCQSSDGTKDNEEPEAKVAAVVLYMASPQTMNCYVLMEKGYEYVVNDTLSMVPFDPFEGQSDPDVSTDRVGNFVDAVITKITDCFRTGEVDVYFIAHQNFEKDPDMKAFEERLKMKGYSLDYYDPHRYADNAKDCAREYVERHKTIKNENN